MPGPSDIPSGRRAALSDEALLPAGPASRASFHARCGVDRYRDPAVRDLAWLLESVPLLSRERFGERLAQLLPTHAERAQAAAWLAALDADPLPLHEMLRARPQSRLGLYAEQLLAYFFAHGTGPRLIEANRAVRVDGHTLGECDFLLTGPGGQPLHWELAVKCYLHAGGPTTSLAQYVGPNLADRFDLKLDRLLGHQLMLSAHPQIAALAPGQPWHPAMLVCGWLFYRWSRAGADAHEVGPNAVDTASPLASEHARGWWTTAAEWPPFDVRAWTIVPRLRWMAPLRFADADDVAVLRNPADVLQRCVDYWHSRPDQPLMVAALESDADEPGIAAGLRECSRGFIVPDAWPAQARLYAAMSPVSA